MKDVYLEIFFENFFGKTWRAGNNDGSRYGVDSSSTKVLTPELLKEYNITEKFGWNFENNEKNQFWLYIGGEIVKVGPPEFQKFHNISQRIGASQKQTPLDPASDSADSKINIARSGNVKFGVSLVSFYTAIAHLIINSYKGAGEFQQILDFAPEQTINYKESFVSNQYGNYFRMQTFRYTSPTATADVTTIDSNQLYHIQTGAALLVSFALLDFPASSSATLYFNFEGSKSEVEKLMKAVTPELEADGFAAIEAR